MASELKDYDILAAARDDDREKGEVTARRFKKSRFQELDGGQFWLSESPNQPGSKSWDAAIARMVTWVKLSERRQPNAKPIAFFNTHFDHKGRERVFRVGSLAAASRDGYGQVVSRDRYWRLQHR